MYLTAKQAGQDRMAEECSCDGHELALLND